MPWRAHAVLGSSLPADSEYHFVYSKPKFKCKSVRRLGLNRSDSQDSVSAHSYLDSNSNSLQRLSPRLVNLVSFSTDSH
jgi:hypothetical protein